MVELLTMPIRLQVVQPSTPAMTKERVDLIGDQHLYWINAIRLKNIEIISRVLYTATSNVKQTLLNGRYNWEFGFREVKEEETKEKKSQSKFYQNSFFVMSLRVKLKLLKN